MSGGSGGAERRSSKRIDTHRHVVFSDYRATGPLRTGTAVDQSTGGLRIVTPHPETVGTTIQVELQQDPVKGGGVALFQGRVVHVMPLDNGDYAMGIRLLQRGVTGAPADAARETTPAGASKPAPAPVPAAARLRAVPAGMTMTPMSSETAAPVTFRRMKRTMRPGSWGALAAILLLVVILVLLIIGAVNEEFGDQARGLFGGVRLHGVVSPNPERNEAHQNRSAGAESLGIQRVASVTPTTPLLLSQRDDVDAVLTQQPESPAGRELHVFEPTRTGRSPAQSLNRFFSRLDYARQAARHGNRGTAMAVLRRALRDETAAPEVWRATARAYLAELERHQSGKSALEFDNAVSLQPMQPQARARSAVRAEVDRTSHLLRVWQGERVVAEYPVGLGRDGGTPLGEFRIGNKIQDPDWYHDGQVVLAGSPENPLGRQWLGLSASGHNTAYGIHPTDAAESIGGDASQGCVRMRPADAESLFRLIPVGARVTIHD